MLKLELKKVFLFAIAPALITGLFTIAPKLYEIATEQSSELTYSMIVGPEMQVQNGFQKIIAVTVENSGKKTLSNVAGTLTVADGAFLSNEVEKSNTLPTEIAADNQHITLAIKKLHPHESFVISTLVLANRQRGMLPEFGIRSDEVLGIPKVSNPSATSFSKWLAPLLSALAVGLVTFMFLFSRLAYDPSKADPSAATVVKDGMLYYIAARLQLQRCLDHWSNGGLTYHHFADLMLSHGLSGPPAERARTVMALKCLLLVKNMAPVSKAITVRNLNTLEGGAFDQNQIDAISSKAIELEATSASSIAIRDLIDNQINATTC